MWRRAAKRERPLRRVGVALAAYRPDLGLFRNQLESIRNQDHDNWFCVVTMDSPLPTQDEAPWLSEYLADDRFTFMENRERLGAVKNFNRAALAARQMGADAICFSDQDDGWSESQVKKSLMHLNQTPPKSALFVDARVILRTPNGRMEESYPRSHYQIPLPLEHRYLMFISCAWGNGMIFDSELLLDHPTFPDHVGHDNWIEFLASSYGGCHFVPEVLFDYVLHDGNLIGIKALQRRPRLDNEVFHEHIIK